MKSKRSQFQTCWWKAGWWEMSDWKLWQTVPKIRHILPFHVPAVLELLQSVSANLNSDGWRAERRVNSHSAHSFLFQLLLYVCPRAGAPVRSFLMISFTGTKQKIKETNTFIPFHDTLTVNFKIITNINNRTATAASKTRG